MTLNIDSLKSVIGKYGGLAVANRFNINIPGLIADDITVLCQTISLPGRTILTQDYQNEEMQRSFPFVYDDGDLSITFMLTNNYEIYQYFLDWMGEVLDTKTYIAGYRKYYKHDIILNHLDTLNIPVKTFRIFDAWPKSITPIELSSTNENQFSIFTVNLSFKNFTID